jgi:hypothetical protein
MLDSGLLIGAPRLRILNTDLITVVKTLYLPFVNKEGGVVLTDTPAKNIKQILVSGGLRYIQGGVRHNVTLNYEKYDPTYIAKLSSRTIGSLDGNVPELTQLYDLISQYNDGRLSISPCSNQEIWYRVACTSDLTRETIYPIAFGNITLTFEGLDVFSDSSSTTVIG